MVDDHIARNVNDIKHEMSELRRVLGDLNRNIKEFNEKSGHLQTLLVVWTAAIALATILSLFRGG